MAFVALAVVATVAGACGAMNGYDAARYAVPEPEASVDPEIVPLPPSKKQRMRDPRGVVDGGVFANASAEVNADADAGADASADASANANASASAGAAGCGTKAEPCPMQRFMHGAMETAHTPDTLTAAFTRVAGMSPDPAWAWVAIATRGADLANAGDVPGAKAQCRACHDAYREEYRALHRTRPL